jgi:hypothetical protein
MSKGIPLAALADVEATAKLFTMTLRREVTASETKPLAEASLLVGGLYVNGDGRVIGGCFADKAFAAHAGAALSLVPAAVAHESIAADQPEEILMENFAEVLNICSRLFDRGSDQRVTLRAVEEAGTPRSPTSLDMLRNPARRHDLELDIDGYGKGRVVLALVAG